MLRPEPRVGGGRRGHLKERSIRRSALAMLCEVQYFERRDRPRGPANRFAADEREPGVEYTSVGLPYDKIVRRIHEEFPGSNTSIPVLRWYAVHVRLGDFVERDGHEWPLPYRRERVPIGTGKRLVRGAAQDTG